MQRETITVILVKLAKSLAEAPVYRRSLLKETLKTLRLESFD